MPTLYFAVRNDSGGTGTKADPYDAAGYGLDTRLRTLQQAATNDVIAFIGPGTIGTYGQGNGTSTGFLIRSGWKLIGGWGGGTTTLRFDHLYGSPPAGTMLGTDDGVTGVHIRDLAIDLNYDVLKAEAGGVPIKLQAIWLFSYGGASNNIIRDVTITNACAEIAADEGFPCLIGSHGTWATGDMIERVTMTNYRGGTGGGLAIYNSSGTIRHCHVEGSYQIAYGGFDLKNAVFEENTCGPCQYAYNTDSNTNTGVIIRHNTFEASLYGIVVAGHVSGVDFSGFVITGNRITMTSGGVFGVTYQEKCVNNLVSGNIFLGGSASTLAWRIIGTGNSGNMFQDNVVPSNWTVSAPGGCVYNTMNADGSPHTGITNTQGTPCTPGRSPELGINYGHVAAMTAL